MSILKVVPRSINEITPYETKTRLNDQAIEVLPAPTGESVTSPSSWRTAM